MRLFNSFREDPTFTEEWLELKSLAIARANDPEEYKCIENIDAALNEKLKMVESLVRQSVELYGSSSQQTRDFVDSVLKKEEENWGKQ